MIFPLRFEPKNIKKEVNPVTMRVNILLVLYDSIFKYLSMKKRKYV